MNSTARRTLRQGDSHSASSTKAVVARWPSANCDIHVRPVCALAPDHPTSPPCYWRLRVIFWLGKRFGDLDSLF
jgi:hypothetical protein